jgi:hypothetical protein
LEDPNARGHPKRATAEGLGCGPLSGDKQTAFGLLFCGSRINPQPRHSAFRAIFVAAYRQCGKRIRTGYCSHLDLPRQSRRRHAPPGGFVFGIRVALMIENLDGLDQWESAFDRRSIGRTNISKGALLFFSEKTGMLALFAMSQISVQAFVPRT